MTFQRHDRLAGPRPHARRQVHVDFPCWMVERLDAESERLGVTRQALIKLWIAERLGDGESWPCEGMVPLRDDSLRSQAVTPTNRARPASPMR